MVSEKSARSKETFFHYILSCEIAIATFPQNVKVRGTCEKLSNTQMIKGTYAKTKRKSGRNIGTSLDQRFIVWLTALSKVGTPH